MNYKFMRLLVFFDLPMLTDRNRKDYQQFHKYLIKQGFIMMQKSVYSKLVINYVTSEAVRKDIAGHLPREGIVELLEITENQFSRIEFLIGDAQQTTIDSMDRIVEI